MPPKKTQAKAKRGKSDEQGRNHGKGKNQRAKSQDSGGSESEEKESPDTGDKRKEPPTDSEPPTVAMKLDSSSREVKLIKFLPSPRALELCENSKTDPPFSDAKIEKDYFTPTLTPFEYLLCAIIVSHPISHVLGQRTIKTVLNDPWNFSDPKNILKAGKENEDGKTQRVEAMEQAKTQHR
jgi:hypothetical protein